MVMNLGFIATNVITAIAVSLVHAAEGGGAIAPPSRLITGGKRLRIGNGSNQAMAIDYPKT